MHFHASQEKVGLDKQNSIVFLGFSSGEGPNCQKIAQKWIFQSGKYFLGLDDNRRDFSTFCGDTHP